MAHHAIGTGTMIGYYVRCVKGAGAHALWKPLLGPFKTHKAASMMIAPVQRLCERHGIYNGCTFSAYKERGDKLPRGRLDLEKYADAEWLGDIIHASKRHT